MEVKYEKKVQYSAFRMKKAVRRWGRDSGFKSSYYSSRGPKFGSKNSFE